jgi:hypothetical protein
VFAGASLGEIAQSVAVNEGLLRISIAVELLCYVLFLVVVLALHRLLSPAGKFAASLMVALAAASVPLACANVAHHFAVLRALEGGAEATVTNAIAAAMAAYDDGVEVLKIFWGGWLLPFGYLVFRSGFLPRTLGVLLILGGLGYIADFAAALLRSGYDASGLARVFRTPRIAEILISLWLLIFGARRLFLP